MPFQNNYKNAIPEKRFFLFLSILLLQTIFSFACICDPWKPLEKDQKQYNLIFQGTIVSIDTSGAQGVAKINVSKYFLGSGPSQLDLKYDNLSDCRVAFFPGEEWIIYGNYKTFGNHHVHFCSHSRIRLPDSTDYYFTERSMNFEKEIQNLESIYGSTITTLNENDTSEFPNRLLKHPERGTSIWYILAAIPVFLLILWYLKNRLNK